MVPERTPKPDAPAPQALNKYRLVGKLAQGGMAELFLARANGLGGFERLLVIKRILPELSRDPELVRMLLDEARTAALLQHANIVQVFDVDMVDGNVFYAMEYLQGQHVLSVLERMRVVGAKLPLENAIAIAVGVAAGLHYAHERWGSDGQPLGIVHRDVAPNNVIVTYDGNIKLIDFGIAKSAHNLSRTRFGLFKGKLPYASPEQCRCEPVDRRTDVFSLGVLLYELTTGVPLFVADSEYELLRLMTEAIVPRPRLRDKAYPRELEKIVLKALARDPADRYQTTQELQLDLEVFAGKAGLDLSAFSLSRLMSSLFQGELDDWRIAQSHGLSLEQHITKTMPNWVALDETATWRPAADDDGAETIKKGEPVRRSNVRRVPLRWYGLAFAMLVAGAIVGWVVATALRDTPEPARSSWFAPSPPLVIDPDKITIESPVEGKPVDRAKGSLATHVDDIRPSPATSVVDGAKGSPTTAVVDHARSVPATTIVDNAKGTPTVVGGKSKGTPATAVIDRSKGSPTPAAVDHAKGSLATRVDAANGSPTPAVDSARPAVDSAKPAETRAAVHDAKHVAKRSVESPADDKKRAAKRSPDPAADDAKHAAKRSPDPAADDAKRAAKRADPDDLDNMVPR